VTVLTWPIYDATENVNFIENIKSLDLFILEPLASQDTGAEV